MKNEQTFTSNSSSGMNAVEAFLFANTPSYLFKNLVRSNLPKELADALSAQQLKAVLDEIGKQQKISPEMAATAYSALIALIAKGEAFNPRKIQNLPWTEKIIALARSTFATIDQHETYLATWSNSSVAGTAHFSGDAANALKKKEDTHD